MNSFKTIILTLLFVIPSSTFGQQTDVIYKQLDVIIFNNYIKSLNQKKQSSVGDLIIQTAVFLMDSPYATKTLEECGNTEKLVINLRKFDCVTLVENCMALVHTLKNKDQTFDYFCSELKTIRYRNAEIKNYCSRLHYFNDWIANNETKAKVINITPGFGGKTLAIKADYMTNNQNLYPQLGIPEYLSEMKTIEQNLSQRRNTYISKDIPASNKIRNGDILCLTSANSGIGIAHVGFAFRLGKDLYFLNASQTNHKVEISSITFNEYLNQHKNFTGYMIVRPL